MKKHVTAFFTGKIPGADPAQLSKILNINADKIYMPIQKHTDKIAVIESTSPPLDRRCCNNKRTWHTYRSAGC